MALELLEDQITCSVCLELYQNPKILGCQHSFCLQCVNKLKKDKEGEQSVICPTCSKESILPNNEGADSLQTNHVLVNLFDVREKLMRADDSMETTQQTMCPEHRLLLNAFCHTCMEVICRDCTISHAHKTHEFELISECYYKHYQELQGHLRGIKGKVDGMTVAITGLTVMEENVTEQGEKIMTDIEKHTDEITELIRESKKSLLDEVEDLVRRKKDLLARQKREAEKLLNQLQECEHMVEKKFQELKQMQILKEKQSMIAEMTSLSQKINPTMFQPIENAEIHFARNLAFLGISHQEIGRCTGSRLDTAILKSDSVSSGIFRPSTATLLLKSIDGSPFPFSREMLSCRLVYSVNETCITVPCEVKTTQNGEHQIAYTPQDRSQQLQVQLGGIDVPGSPFFVQAIVAPKERGTNGGPLRTITGLNGPCGMAVLENGKIVVAEKDAHCVTLLDKEGQKEQSFGIGKLQLPRGVAASATNGHILVTDEDQLHLLSLVEDRIVKSVTISSNSQKKARAYFLNFIGIAASPKTGEIFVSDSGERCIHVFDKKLQLLYSFKGQQAFNSQSLQEPMGLVFDETGNYLYVAEHSINCVAKIDPMGRIVARIGLKGHGPSGGLCGPFFIHVANGFLYVTELGVNRVSIFSTNGEFVHSFSNSRDSSSACSSSCGASCGVVMNKMGDLFVGDGFNQINIF